METLFILIPLAVILVTVLYGVFQALVQAWVDYRVRVALLEKLERDPGLVTMSGDLTNIIVGNLPAREFSPRQNYAVTGLILAGIGLICVAAGRLLRLGEVAVGAFLGGMVCIFLGLIIALLGFMIRVATKSTSPTANK
jgi:hypothetical protein